MQKFTRDLIIAFTFGIVVIVGSNLAFSQPKQGIEWREKPVQCGPEQEFWPVLNSHGEKALLGAIAKLEGPDEPTTYLPVYVFTNTDTGTFTIAEFHLHTNEVCIIGYGSGIDFDVQDLFQDRQTKQTDT